MTRKEKAEDLLLKYSILSEGNNDLVKQCAIIAVDEMMDEFWKTYNYESRLKYWHGVKLEIEKL